MKSNFWLFGGLAWLAAASAFAQTPVRDTNSPGISTFITGPLAKETVLDPPWTATVKIETLIVRAQPAWAGDQLRARVVKGQTLTVLEQITLAKPKLNEPTNWARILLPTNTPVWVFAEYINTNTMTVTARRVNVRGGPGDNFGVVALLEKGASVKEVRRNADWIEIVPPANAIGYVASDYLTMQPPATPPPAVIAATAPAATAPAATAPATAPAATAPPATEPVAVAPVAGTPVAPEPVAPAATAPATVPPVATAPVTPEAVAPVATNTSNETNTTHEATNTASATAAAPPIVAPEPVATTPPAATVPPETTPSTAPVATAPVAVAPVATAPAPAPSAAATADTASIDTKPRVVTREGYVRKSLNLQAPADYELREVNSKAVIEYLQPDAQDKNFKKYNGVRVLVSGTEWLDPRWLKTPILRVQSIQTVDLVP